MIEPLLRLQGLTKRYGALAVTNSVDVSVLTGSIHAIIGPNGAGKTSLVNQISGFVRPDSGTIAFAGHQVTRLTPHARARLGLSRVFQISSLFPEFSARQNVALAVQRGGPAALHPFGRVARNRAMNQAAQELLSRVGLPDKADQPVHQLSHGEQRQLELAVALATRPRLLLLDEPLAGAGQEETTRLVALLGTIRQECTILLVEHDMTAVFRLADTISVLAQGRIIATGSPAEIRANLAVRLAYLGDLADEEAAAAAPRSGQQA